MDMTRVKTIVKQLLRSPLKFPVEAAMGLAFFVIAVSYTGHAADDAGILWLFVPLMVLTLVMHNVNRVAYVVSGLLFLPLMSLNLKPFLWTYGFGFTYVIAAILLVLGTRRLDNRSFAAHVLHVVTQMFFAMVITGLLTVAVVAVVGSFFYIFGISEPKYLYEYILEFIWFFIAPQVCCTLVSRDEYEVREPAAVLRMLLNFILSPAVIIYTVILYAYFIKIAIEWNLPKGGVAWMVMGFVTVALAGRLLQYVLTQRYYEWYYSRFTWIAIPPLIMYWIGSIYRIRLYSFTESRFYLMVAGVLMTLFVLMLLWRRTRRFQLMAVIFGCAIVMFTYIPGISAKSIGLRCQTERMMQFAHELKLIDGKTGKLVSHVNREAIVKDSVLCNRYQEACDVIDYVSKGMGYDEFKKQYGEWDYDAYQFNSSEYGEPVSVPKELKQDINLGDYDVMVPKRAYNCRYSEGEVRVAMNGVVVLSYPIDEEVSERPQILAHPEQLFVHKNDSLMLVLNEIYLRDKQVSGVSCYGALLFRKSR